MTNFSLTDEILNAPTAPEGQPMAHPLTNEDCKQILIDVTKYWEPEKDPSTPMFHELMRASADWQLEQVIEWLKTELEYDPELDNARRYLHLDLKKAMRPQEDN